jgi:hypothetical protein
MTVIKNFTAMTVPGLNQDIIDISVKAWSSGGTNGNGGLAHGLVEGRLSAPPDNSASGLNAQIQDVDPGSSIGFQKNVLRLTTGMFANADEVVKELHSGKYTLTFSALGDFGANDSEHMIVVYQGNNVSGSPPITCIMDLAITNSAPLAFQTVTTADPTVTLHGSDMVCLVGVKPSDLDSSNIHFVS